MYLEYETLKKKLPKYSLKGPLITPLYTGRRQYGGGSCIFWGGMSVDGKMSQASLEISDPARTYGFCWQ